jgi:hypothetical protein
MPTTPFRVTDVWVKSEPLLTITLDFLGVTEGSEAKQVASNVFALVATMMAHGKPVYYSRDDDAMSTDPFFASHPADQQPFPQPLKVIDTDLLWKFGTNTGKLILTLQNRSVTYFDMNDPVALIGWAQTCKTHAVLFDGVKLNSRQDLGQQKDPVVAAATVNTRIF